jgi:hypothetical protein
LQDRERFGPDRLPFVLEDGRPGKYAGIEHRRMAYCRVLDKKPVYYLTQFLAARDNEIAPRLPYCRMTV